MATATKPYVVTDEHIAMQPSTRSGWVTFAGTVFLVGGFANLFWGLAALADKAYLDAQSVLYSTLNTWGWVAVIWSAVVLVGAVLLFARVKAAPIVGVVLASISCVFWLFAFPVLPLLAMTAILLDAMVIYGLIVHGMEF
jgi:hypothetical protein